ncbi:hypothetical protein ACSBR2_012025 [Camellia fascicularis]
MALALLKVVVPTPSLYTSNRLPSQSCASSQSAASIDHSRALRTVRCISLSQTCDQTIVRRTANYKPLIWGRTVVIEQSFGGPKVTKDGVTVAKSIEFKDKVKNVGTSLVKQVANATNDEAGDGTMCATIFTQAIFAEGCKSVAAGMNAMELRRGITMAVDALVTDSKAGHRWLAYLKK